MLIRISRQSGYVDIVEKSLNRHENHRGICGLVSRTMPVSIPNRSAHGTEDASELL
jgi:hypothetical protein